MSNYPFSYKELLNFNLLFFKKLGFGIWVLCLHYSTDRNYLSKKILCKLRYAETPFLYLKICKKIAIAI